MPAAKPNGPPEFDSQFQAKLFSLFEWRRDVRRFKRDPLSDDTLALLLSAANLAPSVGLSQPWRFVQVIDPARRAEVRENFQRANKEALADYDGERANNYARLKLAGLDEAPVHFAVFCDEATTQGHGLGRKSMPEMLRYSVVTAVQNLWLAARSLEVGVGWVSILEPQSLNATLSVPEDWTLVAYLCVGYPQEDAAEPELQRQGWEERRGLLDMVIQR
jgi:5,6-dimethylbenzimidazole synthase